MAYVGTPSSLGSDVNTLASILQGESSTAQGQTAVANVMANRAAQNFNGYGSDIMSQALAPNQFQGQQTPSAGAVAIAQQALDGSLPNVAGNATYYAAPGATASWAVNALNSGNGTNIGGNYFFADDQGSAISGVGQPAGNSIPSPPVDENGNLIGAQNPSNGDQSANDIGATSPGFLNTPLSQIGLGGLGIGGTAATGDSSLPGMASGGTGGGINPFGQQGSQDSPSGAPVNITDPNAIANKGLTSLGSSVTKTGQAADTTLTSAVSNLNTEATGITQYFGNTVYGVIARGGVGLLAVIFVLMGLWMLGKQSEGAKA